MNMDNKESKALSIELKPETATGKYSNLAIISHSHSEFVLDFAAMLPGLQKPEIISRIVMNPEHAKRLLSALIDNVNKYENQFGPISTAEPQQPKGTINLNDLMNNGGTRS